MKDNCSSLEVKTDRSVRFTRIRTIEARNIQAHRRRKRDTEFNFDLDIGYLVSTRQKRFQNPINIYFYPGMWYRLRGSGNIFKIRCNKHIS